MRRFQNRNFIKASRHTGCREGCQLISGRNKEVKKVKVPKEARVDR